MRICVYAICKDEAKHVARFLEAARDADVILIADTGSTDGTMDAVMGWQFETVDSIRAAVFKRKIHISPWRFDDARNAALALIPPDIDVCVSLDLDEVLQPGWRQEIERVWELGKTTRLRYKFDWGAGIAFYYEKIHARHGYRWHHPCHEYPVPYGIEEVWAQTDKLLVVHQPDNTKSRGQYLGLLKMSVEEDPQCPRNAFYYARELSFHGQWGEALAQCERYLALPRATWPNERCYAMRVASKCCQELGDPAARTWLQRACSEAPNTREPWCELAMLAYRRSDWVECLYGAQKALQITDREAVYTQDPAVWGATPHDLLSIAAWNLGILELSLEHARKAVEFSPEDDRLQRNLEYIEGRLSRPSEAM